MLGMNHNVQVFKEEPGFIKLFLLFKEKYRSLGRIGGNVSLETFNQVELESIAGFLGQPYEKLVRKGNLSLLDFEKELSNTGFSNFTLLHLLETVLQEPIISKKEEMEQEKKLEENFIESLRKAIPNAWPWLQYIQGKTPDTRWIWSLFKKEKEELREQIIMVWEAFSSLPKENQFERLPFFSQRMTGNPHYFDSHETAGKLLLHCMYVDQLVKGNTDAVMPKGVEELNDLLAEYGIMRDDLWNFVTCQGLLASNEQNEIHPVWQAAVQTNTVMNIPMKVLVKVDRVWPNIGNNVWVVENSSVCSTIMDAVPNAAVICTHGQLRSASWRLLDMLAESGCTLYYSGDLDPEGVVIAQKLMDRYGDQLILWRMDKETYEFSLSDEDITSRLTKLDHITAPVWKELIHLMKQVKKAGYQEAIGLKLINDIHSNLKN
ncbi:uncharacterized protein (TIGR02679 family) [Oikeobacillus pervagus]|uniref:Uncharacterized protein (TIGR02679 family) n=2 Tax=Oikeobacillus pervagus TaxID=1325931 RepID=A0AAJ1T0H9_9BACI|nr:uncharacterized protein (TIGR02679 family) [Oikeobacillus pervagus]